MHDAADPPGGDAASDAAVDGPALDAASDAPVDVSIDAAPVFACTTMNLTCNGTKNLVASCNGKCWIGCTDGVDQPTAKASCGAIGGLLAPLYTQQDDDCLHLTVLPSRAKWTGYEQAPGQTADDVGWTWGGIAMPYTHWAGGQPNDNGAPENDEENCAYVSTSGVWHDDPCTAPHSFACREP